MAFLTKADPDAALDIICVHTQPQGLATGAVYKLPDGSRIDIGLYDYVVVLVANAGGSATGALTVTPRESDSQTGPEFALDGTNGAPDFSMSFLTAVSGATTNASHHRSMNTRERRQFLNLSVSTVLGVGTWRPVIYMIGCGKRSNTGNLVNTDIAQRGPVV